MGQVSDQFVASNLYEAMKAMLEETAKVQPMPIGLGLARYKALAAVETAERHARRAVADEGPPPSMTTLGEAAQRVVNRLRDGGSR